jgi:hypothetical protein
MKVKFLSLLLVIFILSCGFEPKGVKRNINFNLESSYDNFNNVLISKINSQQDKKLTLKINKLTSNSYQEAYENNQAKIYRLVVNIDFSLAKDKNTILNNQLSGEKFITKTTNTNFEVLTDETFSAIQDELAEKIINIIDAYNK